MKHIPNLPGYLINTDGFIYSTKVNRFLVRGNKKRFGDFRSSITLGGKFYYASRLMGITYLGLDITDKKTCVCHKDDDVTNNKLSNLFLGSHTDNMQDMIKKGRHKYGPNSKNPGGGKYTPHSDEEKEYYKLHGRYYPDIPKPKVCRTVFQHTKDGVFIREFRAAIEASKELGLDRSSISRACRGELIKYRRNPNGNIYGGFVWSYKD